MFYFEKEEIVYPPESTVCACLIVSFSYYIFYFCRILVIMDVMENP